MTRIEPIGRWSLSLNELPLSLSVTGGGQVWLVDAEHRLFLMSGEGRSEVLPPQRGALGGALMSAAPRGADDLWLLARGGDGKNRLATWRPGEAGPGLVELPLEPEAVAWVEDTGQLFYIATDRTLHCLLDGTSTAMGDIRCNALAASSEHVVCLRQPDDMIVHASLGGTWTTLRPAGTWDLVGLTAGSEVVLLKLEPWRKGEDPPDSTVLGVSLDGDERVILTGRVAMAVAAHSFVAAVVLDPAAGLSVELYQLEI